jgi:hypothetical protein
MIYVRKMEIDLDGDDEMYDFVDTADDIDDETGIYGDDEHQYDNEIEQDYASNDEDNDVERKSPTILAEDQSLFKSPLTPMPYVDTIDDTVSLSEASVTVNKSPINTESQTETGQRKSIIRIEYQDENEAIDEKNFKYQQELRIYVNRCMFIRNTHIGKRVGFAPTIPKITEFVLCWNCNDWIPPHVSPPCVPLCSQTHMHSKYVFEKMIGYFCSWGCCKKYIHETMSERNKTKYMRSLLQLRRIFFPDDNDKPIQMSPSRTCTTLYGGPIDPETYYSKIDKVNLPPLAEDTLYKFNFCSIDDPSTDGKISKGGANDDAMK